MAVHLEAMTKQHFIPAAFLGRFSLDKGPLLRHRRVWVANREPHRAYISRTEGVAAIGGFYDLQGDIRGLAKGAVDSVWTKYERRLTFALDELSDIAPPSMSANVWLRAAVPFITSLFVRGPHFAQTQLKVDTLGHISSHFNEPHLYSDSINMSRNLAIQRYLAPIMASDWTVIHAPLGTQFMTTDVGYTNWPGSEDIIIPIGLRTALQLRIVDPRYARMILFDQGNADWRAVIHHRYATLRDVGAINVRLMRTARSFIVCNSERDAISCLRFFHRNPDPFDVNLSILAPPSTRRIHEFTWHRAVSLIAQPYSSLSHSSFPIDWDHVFADWCPIPVLPFTLDVFDGALHRWTRCVSISVAWEAWHESNPDPWNTLDDDRRRQLHRFWEPTDN